jgi:hypothetical protein
MLRLSPVEPRVSAVSLKPRFSEAGVREIRLDYPVVGLVPDNWTLVYANMTEKLNSTLRSCGLEVVQGIWSPMVSTAPARVPMSVNFEGRKYVLRTGKSLRGRRGTWSHDSWNSS